MTACTSVPARSPKRIWLIDPEDLVLYRVINDETEIALPLRSPAVQNFMCIDREEYNLIVEESFSE